MLLISIPAITPFHTHLLIWFCLLPTPASCLLPLASWFPFCRSLLHMHTHTFKENPNLGNKDLQVHGYQALCFDKCTNLLFPFSSISQQDLEFTFAELRFALASSRSTRSRPPTTIYFPSSSPELVLVSDIKLFIHSLPRSRCLSAATSGAPLEEIMPKGCALRRQSQGQCSGQSP